MGSIAMATQHLLRNLILRPLHRTTTVIPTAKFYLHRSNHRSTTTSYPILHVTRPLCTLQATNPVTADLKEETNSTESDTEENEKGEEKEKEKSVMVLSKREVPVLSIKEKKEVGSYANGLGDKLKIQQIGKSGVTGNVAFGLDETLEKNELLKCCSGIACNGVIITAVMKLITRISWRQMEASGSDGIWMFETRKGCGRTITPIRGIHLPTEGGPLLSYGSNQLKIHRNCPGEIEDVVRQLEEATGSVAVGQIGRTVILYRPSVTKLKAEEKKEQNRKIFEQKRKKFQSSMVQKWKKRDSQD